MFGFQEADPDNLDRTAGAIRGRSGRICNVVASEMDNYEPGLYTERVMEAIRLLSERVMPNFAHKVENAVGTLSEDPKGIYNFFLKNSLNMLTFFSFIFRCCRRERVH